MQANIKKKYINKTSLADHMAATNTNAHSFSNISGQVTGAQIALGTITIANLDVTTSLGAWDQNASDDVTNTTQFSGDVSGTASNIKIKSGSVGTTELADNAITGAKVQDGSLSLSDFSTTTFDKWDTDKNDDVTTSTQFGGDINGTASNLQITTGSIVTSDLASQNISQWINDLNFVTANSLTGYDSDAGDDLITSTSFSGDVSGTYNTLQLGTDVVTTTEIKNGTITTNDLNLSDAKVGIDARYLKLSGGTITGDLTVGNSTTDTLTVTGDIDVDGTVDGVDVKGLSNKVDGLEKNQAPSSASSFAYGSCSYAIDPNRAVVSNSYNTDSCEIAGYPTKVSFTTDASNANYVVMLTQTAASSHTIYVCIKNKSYFSVCRTDNTGSPDPFDFVVFTP